jgi:tetratricopeptide (TPR) repeat protein
MRTTWSAAGWSRAALGVLLLAAMLAPVQAADDGLKNKVLQLNAVTGDDPATGKIIALLEDAPGSKKLLAAALGLVKDKTDQPLNTSATYILARTASGLKDLEAGRVFYELYIAQVDRLESSQKVTQGYEGLIQLYFDQKKSAEAMKLAQKFLERIDKLGNALSEAQAFATLIQLYYDNKKFADCLKVCQKVLELDSDEPEEQQKLAILKLRVQRLMVMTNARQGKTDEALKMVETMIKRSPDNWLLMELKAKVLREAGENEQAAKLYEDIMARVRKEERLDKETREDVLNGMRYSLSGLYVDLNQIDKAAEQLKALLAKDPDNPTYNNDLGFIWADHDMNLVESEKLIRKAIEDDRKQKLKDNPDLKPESVKSNLSYLDSLGWVLYKQKKYKEAKPHLEEAVSGEEGQNLEIYDHLGDVLMALGEKDAAISAWKKGLETATESKRDKKRKVEVEKKIKGN